VGTYGIWGIYVYRYREGEKTKTPLTVKKFICPADITPNPKSKHIVQAFLESGLDIAEIDISWGDFKRVSNRLYQFVRFNPDFNLIVETNNNKLYLYKPGADVSIIGPKTMIGVNQVKAREIDHKRWN
jgi:hypothetical protein